MNTRTSRRSGLVCGALLASVAAAGIASSAHAAGDIVWNQLPAGPNGFVADGQTGQFYDEAHADDFILATSTQVNGVSWVGFDENYISPAFDNVDSFRIEIFSNAAGLPGTSLMTVIVPLAATNMTLTGATTASGGAQASHSIKFAPITLSAGTYWISIGADLIGSQDDAWIWSHGATSNNVSAFQTPALSGPWASIAGDQAFAIQGVIPAPGAFGLMAAAGLLGRRRRRA